MVKVVFALLLVKEVGEIQCLCRLLLAKARRERDERIFGGVLVEEDANLLDWLLSFFFSPSRRRVSAGLTCWTFVSFNPAGRTHWQRKPESLILVSSHLKKIIL